MLTVTILVLSNILAVYAQADQLKIERTETGFTGSFTNPQGTSLFVKSSFRDQGKHLIIMNSDKKVITSSFISADIIAVTISEDTRRFFRDKNSIKEKRLEISSETESDRLKQFGRSEEADFLRQLSLRWWPNVRMWDSICKKHTCDWNGAGRRRSSR